VTGEAGVTEESDSVDRKSVELIFAVQEVKDMSVKKATLLEFDGIDTCHMCDKDVVTAELLQHFLESKLKTRAAKSGRSRQVCIRTPLLKVISSQSGLVVMVMKRLGFLK